MKNRNVKLICKLNYILGSRSVSIRRVLCSVVTVLDFPFSIGFGSVLEEKPRFRFRFRFFSYCRVDQSTCDRDVLCTRSTHLKPHRID